MQDVADRFTKHSTDVSRPGPRPAPLRRDEALALLREHAPEIERRTGVRPLALFGSVARDEATVESDVDVLVQYVGDVGWGAIVRAEVYLEELLGARVDMLRWETLTARVRPYVERDLRRVA